MPPATATSNSAPPQLPGERCATAGALGAAAGLAHACFCAAQKASMTRRNCRGSKVGRVGATEERIGGSRDLGKEGSQAGLPAGQHVRIGRC